MDSFNVMCRVEDGKLHLVITIDSRELIIDHDGYEMDDDFDHVQMLADAVNVSLKLVQVAALIQSIAAEHTTE